jgi:two-component system nitrate/nitrite response regulator NarL
MESSISTSGISDQLAALSDRQREVVILVCRGLSNRLIADTLGVSEGTIKAHLHTIFEKLDVQSRIELMILLSNPKVMQSAA